MLAICLILFPPLSVVAFDVIEAIKQCNKRVQEDGSYHLGIILEISRFWVVKEMENKKSCQKSFSNGSMKQSIYLIGVPSQNWKSFGEKRDNLEKISINN